jgi:hypothetical protein
LPWFTDKENQMSDFGRLQELARAAGVQVNAPRNTAVPYVSPETAAVGDTLSVTMGEWTGEPDSYTYAWCLDGADTGATGTSYTTVAGNEGHTITCVVTATNEAGVTTAPPSNAVTIAAAAARRTTPPVHSPEHPPVHDARTDPARRK